MNIYITRVDTNGAEDQNEAPVDAIFSVSVNGEKITNDRGSTRWFTNFDAAANAVFDKLDLWNVKVDAIRWIAQYDSAWGEALDEPCGYVGKIAS